MFVTTHDVAVYEKFLLVAVGLEDGEDFSGGGLGDAVEDKDWVMAQNKPTVLGYIDGNEDINSYADENLVDVAPEIPYI